MTTFTPAETVARTGFTLETLRYYERIGLLRDVGRDGSGHRCFTPEHVSWLEILRCLRDTGMPIATMQRYVDLAGQDDSVAARLQVLAEHDRAVSQQISSLRRSQKHLRDKIAFYERVLADEQVGAAAG